MTVLPLHPTYVSVDEVKAAVPDWHRRLRLLHEQTRYLYLPCANLDFEMCSELEVEVPLIRSSLERLDAQALALTAAISTVPRGTSLLSTGEFDRVLQFESLLRRTEARAYVLIDALRKS